MKKISPITVQTTVNASIGKVWEFWNDSEHIVHWAFASDEWSVPYAENNLQIGGTFKIRMEAKDQSEGFDFEGVYTNINEYKHIEYDMSDGRHVKIEFESTPEGVKVTETFDPENKNSQDLQRAGWQAILENFKKYTESK